MHKIPNWILGNIPRVSELWAQNIWTTKIMSPSIKGTISRGLFTLLEIALRRRTVRTQYSRYLPFAVLTFQIPNSVSIAVLEGARVNVVEQVVLIPVRRVACSSRCKSHKNPSYLHGGKCGAVTTAALYIYKYICRQPRRTCVLFSFVLHSTLNSDLEPAIGSYLMKWVTYFWGRGRGCN